MVYFVYRKGSMNTVIQSKINKLMTELPTGVVYLSRWLADNGYSYDLQKKLSKKQLAYFNRKSCHGGITINDNYFYDYIFY